MTSANVGCQIFAGCKNSAATLKRLALGVAEHAAVFGGAFGKVIKPRVEKVRLGHERGTVLHGNAAMFPDIVVV